MKQIFFKARFVPLIMSGQKSQTVRAKTRLRPGDVVQARNRYELPAFTFLKVLAVDAMRRDELTEADATADGFNSLSELQQTLTELYPELSESSELYRIRFERTDIPARTQTELFQPDSSAPAEP